MKSSNISQKRFSDIAKLGASVFSIDDLARIWRIKDRNNLHITLSRYVKSGLIYRLYRGLYSINEKESLNPLVLGSKAINNYCYLSTESVLAREGAIFQKINYYTFVSDKSRRFEIAGHKYYTRQLQDKFLYNSTSIKKEGSIYVASLERAVADILHYNPQYHLDNRKAIDWDKVKKIQIALGYKIT